MRRRNVIVTKVYESPCGRLLLGVAGGGLCMCDWLDSAHHSRVLRLLSERLDAEFAEGASDVIAMAEYELDEYFSGRRRRFDVPLLTAGTEFQELVWRKLLGIPYGRTISYKEAAALVGRCGSVRATANAVGANAISIFVPCHRVTGCDGSLTGYAGGIDAKRMLLTLESESCHEDKGDEQGRHVADKEVIDSHPAG